MRRHGWSAEDLARRFMPATRSPHRRQVDWFMVAVWTTYLAAVVVGVCAAWRM